jgi:small conductance mechanosensitive channel
LEARDADTVVVRLPLLLLRTVLDAAPVVAFAAAGYAVLPLLRPEAEVHVVALTFINAYLVGRGALVVARMVLAPTVEPLRLLPITGETANYLFLWVRRVVAVAVIGYFVAEAALLLGLPVGGHAVLLRLVGLALAALAVLFILQNRVPVARWIAGDGSGRLRTRLGDVWHVLAVVYAVGVFLVWALGIEGGFAYLARATVGTVVIGLIAWVAVAAVGRAVARGFAVAPDLAARFPLLEDRANRYLPHLDRLLRGIVFVAAALALLEAWGVDSFGWLATPVGRRIVQGAVSIALVLVVALVLWEMLNAGVERYLNRTDAEGNVVERSARVRTLLPLMRNAALVVMGVIVVMVVLSELGVDIAPLLAGAGIIGLAVGFGAQTLVKDVITGVFILLEDSVAVGDVVQVAGYAGVVEALTIRSLRLREYSGNVHTIPFSSVDTVTNMTKDFSYAVFEVGIGYRENTDAVSEVLHQVGAELQADPDFAADILEPLEIAGVDRFDDSAVVIKARLKTRPVKQWAVGREFNRRMKHRFDALDIEIPFPHTTLYFGVDKDGNAPPARLRLERGVAAPVATAPEPQTAPEPAAEHHAERVQIPTEAED